MLQRYGAGPSFCLATILGLPPQVQPREAKRPPTTTEGSCLRAPRFVPRLIGLLFGRPFGLPFRPPFGPPLGPVTPLGAPCGLSFCLSFGPPVGSPYFPNSLRRVGIWGMRTHARGQGGGPNGRIRTGDQTGTRKQCLWKSGWEHNDFPNKKH